MPYGPNRCLDLSAQTGARANEENQAPVEIVLIKAGARQAKADDILDGLDRVRSRHRERLVRWRVVAAALNASSVQCRLPTEAAVPGEDSVTAT